MTNSEEQQAKIDAELDNIVDTQNVSYFDAHRILGIDNPDRQLSVDPRIEARQDAHDYYTKEFHLTGPIPEKTAEQRQAAAENIARLHLLVERPKDN